MTERLIDNMQVMLKYQYFVDVSKSTAKPMKSLSDIVYEDVPLTYADIMVWFSNKECSEHLEKKIWDSTPQSTPNKSALDAFLRQYAHQIDDKFKKYRKLLDKLQQIQVVQKRTQQFLEEQKQKCYELLHIEAHPQQQQSKSINFQIQSIEDFNILQFQSDSHSYRYYLEITYQDEGTTVQGAIEAFALKLNFQKEIRMELPLEIGTLQLNLIRKDQDETKIVLAQRNLDPFIAISDEYVQYPLRINNKDSYLNLVMKVSTPEHSIQFLQARLDYLHLQYQRTFKQCHLYKVKLRLLIKPFESIKFDDNAIFLERIQQKKNAKGCNPCNLQ